jgi:bla regulator protein BlaR1
MRTQFLILILALLGPVDFGQASKAVPSFDVSSVKPSRHEVGPDYNNQLTYSPNGITARNVTLKRLVSEAYHLQLNQVFGPGWLSQNEYDVDARTAEVVTREQTALMLRGLLVERFHLATHSETREMRVYELVIGKSGTKIHAVKDGEAVGAQPGFHFHGDLRQFADLLAVQLSIPAPDNPNEPVRASQSPIPVLDKTGLPGIFDFSVDIHPELGTDMFTSWQRTLRDQLGLSIESRKGNVDVMVVDEAARIPTEN